MKNNERSAMTQPKEGDLRVSHIPQVPMQPFVWPVSSREMGEDMMKALAAYDMFQLEHKIKPDFSSVQWLEVFANGEWVDLDDYDLEKAEELPEPERQAKVQELLERKGINS